MACEAARGVQKVAPFGAMWSHVVRGGVERDVAA